MITDEQLEERIRQVFLSVATTRPVPRMLTTRHPARRVGRIVVVGFGIAAMAAAVGLVVAYGPRSTQVTGHGGSPSTRPPAVPTTTAPPTTTSPKQTPPPLNLGTLPVPSDFTCSAGLYFLSPANQVAGECVPYTYVVGGTASNPNNNTACPAGSSMTMGPVECNNETGIVTPVAPGPNTCSTPGGPCPSSNFPLSSQASVIAWSAIEFPTGKCPAGYYFGETNGIATCVPYDYLPGGTSADPNKNTACPAGSGLKTAKLAGTLCTQDAEPYEIVAPTSSTTTMLPATAGPLSAVSTPRSGVLGHVTILATATLAGIPAAETGQLEFDVSPGPYDQGQPASAEAVSTHGPGVYVMPTGYAPYRAGNWFVTVFYEPSPSQGTGPVPTVSGMPAPDNPHPDANLVTVVTAS
jgi:hypothetical protein